MVDEMVDGLLLSIFHFIRESREVITGPSINTIPVSHGTRHSANIQWNHAHENPSFCYSVNGNTSNRCLFHNHLKPFHQSERSHLPNYIILSNYNLFVKKAKMIITTWLYMFRYK